MNDKEAYKSDKLTVTAKPIESSKFYLVKIIGLGDQFQTSVEATSAMKAAKHVVEELTFAAHHPHEFFNRRRLAAQRSGAMGYDFDKMIEVANEAVGYAALNKRNFSHVVYSIDEG